MKVETVNTALQGPGFLARYGKRLLRHGYPILPIHPGLKHPNDKRWQELVTNDASLNAWIEGRYRRGGVGIMAASFPAVDVDVHDASVVATVVDWCQRHIGTAPRRVGEAPKALLPYRTDAPFSKVQSRTFIDGEGRRNKVEILGRGQQYVAYAMHPDTGAPYTWSDGRGIADVPAEKLATITLEQAREVVDFFEDNVPADWTPVQHGSRGTIRGDAGDALANAAAPLDITDEQIDKVLGGIDPDIHNDDWVKVGMGLYHQFGGSEEGFAKWDGWSVEGSKYRADEMRGRWKSFDADLNAGPPITFAYAIKLAKAAGVRISGTPAPEVDHMKRFLARYVYVVDKNEVTDLDKPPNHATVALLNWRNEVANVRHDVEVEKPTVKEPDRTVIQRQPVSAGWLVHPDRKVAQGLAFDPSQPMLFERDGLTWVNKFHMPVFAPSNASTGVFWRHMEYLFPVPVEREWFIDWMAFNLQQPAVRCKVTPLHVARGHGTGRGWVVELLRELLGEWNISKTEMSTLCGEGAIGGYHDYMADSLLCAIEEVREGGKRYEVSDRIRSKLTEPSLELNLKYGDKGTRAVYTNFFLQSNHPDALVLPSRDRRINVLTGPDNPKPDAYYERLYGWLKKPNVAALHGELMSRDLSEFNWTRSMKTVGRTAMVEGNRTETEVAFHDMLEDLPAKAMTFRQVVSAMEAAAGEDAMSVNIDERQVSKLLQHYARQGPRMKVNGIAVRPWVFDETLLDKSEAIREAVKSLK